MRWCMMRKFIWLVVASWAADNERLGSHAAELDCSFAGSWLLNYSDGYSTTYHIDEYGQVTDKGPAGNASDIKGHLSSSSDSKCPGSPCVMLKGLIGYYELLTVTDWIDARLVQLDLACCTAEGVHVTAVAKRTSGSFACPTSLVGSKTNKIIPDSSITVSSTHPTCDSVGVGRKDSSRAWCVRNACVGQTLSDAPADSWISYDLGATKTIWAIQTWGRRDYDQWVTAYKVQLSLDGISWDEYRDILVGNHDRESPSLWTLSPRIRARHVRLHPLTCNKHCSMRVDILGTSELHDTITSSPAFSAEGGSATEPVDTSGDPRGSLEEEDIVWRSTMQDIWFGGYKEGEHPISIPITAECATGGLDEVGGKAWRHVRSRRANSYGLNEEAYQICPQESLHRPGCVVYTCGVDEDPSFEVDLALRHPNCDVFAFDPSAAARRWMGYLIATLDPPLPPNFRYLPWAWGSKDVVLDVPPLDVVASDGVCYDSACSWPWNSEEWGQSSSKWHHMHLLSIARRLNHTKVDLVKMDCEGIEYTPGLLEAVMALKPEQIVLEQHSFQQVEGETLGAHSDAHRNEVTVQEWKDVPIKLHLAGYRPVWTGRMGRGIGEYTWTRRELTASSATWAEIIRLQKEYASNFQKLAFCPSCVRVKGPDEE
eukprot:gnl/TRDRNA2_/TRDRNA2_81425_c0_seq1.p1 gnl/TRDRNA2_/TRDRNA2_81425_c0~~gnl/TRDRNA2_/TRDRNA2_81425_c0_seq1.p1  ORF type:complete len:654 (+),score=87.72 gnl/TRDRNA2_/TRDRNA2_81425_c0_seq1:194-2155(+)